MDIAISDLKLHGNGARFHPSEKGLVGSIIGHNWEISACVSGKGGGKPIWDLRAVVISPKHLPVPVPMARQTRP